MKTSANLIAVILCGGQSARMGEAKYLLAYHGLPQYKWLSQLCLTGLGLPTYLSCQTSQAAEIENGCELIFDQETFAQGGPMTGLLSAAALHPGKPILLLACDYPHLALSDIRDLVLAFEENGKSTCLVHPKTHLEEPLLAIYAASDLAKIKDNFFKDKRSLRQFLHTANHTNIAARNTQVIKSFDTPNDRLNFKGQA
ncbi:MAG: molybdenum cofactor guanylyltransferase [bacterium]|nr:molybdenum cofactor guanylyltransferase [bacterium]